MIRKSVIAGVIASLFIFSNANAIDLQLYAKNRAQTSKSEDLKGANIQKMLNELGEIEAAEVMPIHSVMLLQLKGQKPVFISANGRFLIEGTIKDLWNLAPVKTAAQAKKTWELHLDSFGDGTLLSKFAVLPYGNQSLPKMARIFVSPLALESQELITKLDPTKVNVDLIITPHKQDTITASMRAWCAEKPADAIRALKTGITDGVKQRGCSEKDLEKIMLPMMMSQYFDITSVPYLVRLDGKRSKGEPKSLQKWLEGKSVKNNVKDDINS